MSQPSAFSRHPAFSFFRRNSNVPAGDVTSVRPGTQVEAGAEITPATFQEETVFFSTSKTIRVSKPVLTEENGAVTLSVQVTGGVSGTCFYSTDAVNRGFVDESSSDCFLVGLLYTAMYAGYDLVLEGAVSRKLLFHVRHYVMPMLDAFFEGRLHRVNIRAGSLVSRGYPDTDAVGTGFSGGIDSFHTIREFFLDYHGPPEDRINTLLFFNVGSHGMGHDRARLAWLEQKFAERARVLSGYAKDIGLPFVSVDSNVHAFMQSGHLQTSTLASLSAALFLGRKLRLYYLASLGIPYHAMFYPDSKLERDYDLEKIEDYLLPHLCTETFSAVSGGSECTRAQKTEAICRDPSVRKYLNVCGNPGTVVRNCSACHKCLRTMMALEILGELHNYTDIFDLKRFSRRERSRYIATLLNDHRRDFFFQDLCDLAERMNYDLKSGTTLATRLYMRFTETRFYAFLRARLRRVWR